MSLLLGGPSASKKRRAGNEAEEDEAAADGEEDRISALPEELRLRILSLLPLKSAIRTGAVIHLRSVRFVDLHNLLSSCPRLRTLDLRYCEGVRGTIDCRAGAPHLKSVTVAECNNVNEIHADRASGLRSFRLSSASFPTYDIPVTAPLQDLYISLRGSNSRNPLSYWIRALPDLANLTALTICSVALRRVYALARFGSPACLTKLRNLPNLKELQLLMFQMDSANLAHIYVFFRTCRCPQLERLFVQLPKRSHDTSEDIFLEMAEENEPDEELSEEEEPHEELCEEEETGEELSKEYETEEKLLQDEILEEYMLKDDRLFYEDMYDEDPIDEDISEQSKDDLPEYGLTNLVLAKMMKFKGDYFELRLVSFLLRKATGLKKLLLVAPQGNHMEEFGEDQMDTSRFLETKLSRLERASSNAEIIVSESDPAEIQPLHSDVFAKF
ncbi:hypothetical protein PR202_gb28252 [Eleusine coracana subsp. coracana]|uniref:Uncharacterized protein n=1 Tax=Eleusine coracana subsp. coracana TaxID=191504 RepID=A0AAV5FWB7_ELECO|nr:hypothetical protein PR202_gb28252 [Eleusine coracana subsp. coracana]